MPLTGLGYPTSGQTDLDWLLVALHGWGANAEDLFGLAPYLELSQFQLRFPDAPFPHPQVPGGRMWYAFPFAYDFRTPINFDQQSDLKTSRQQLRDWLIGLEKDTGIPLNRTILAGFSQGGAMTLDVGSQLPLAGQVVLSGYLHSPPHPAKTDRPLLMVHGTFDPVVPIERAHQSRDQLRGIGQSVTFCEIPMGHEIGPEVITLIRDFCEDLRQNPISNRA